MIKNWKKFNEDLDTFYKDDKHKVLVVKCDNDSWYKDFIEEEFDVIEDNSRTNWEDGKERWKVVPDDRTKRLGVCYIIKDDVEVI